MWGWTFVATKILVEELGPVEIFALRLAIGLPFLGGILLLNRVPLRFARADAAPLFLGGAIFTLHVLVQIGGLVTTTATNTGWIISVSPLALAVLSFLFLRAGVWVGQRAAPAEHAASESEVSRAGPA
jgi:drug/metabolite transporter (DMT)-like permease